MSTRSRSSHKLLKFREKSKSLSQSKSTSSATQSVPLVQTQPQKSNFIIDRFLQQSPDETTLIVCDSLKSCDSIPSISSHDFSILDALEDKRRAPSATDLTNPLEYPELTMEQSIELFKHPVLRTYENMSNQTKALRKSNNNKNENKSNATVEEKKDPTENRNNSIPMLGISRHTDEPNINWMCPEDSSPSLHEPIVFYRNYRKGNSPSPREHAALQRLIDANGSCPSIQDSSSTEQTIETSQRCIDIKQESVATNNDTNQELSSFKGPTFELNTNKNCQEIQAVNDDDAAAKSNPRLNSMQLDCEQSYKIINDKDLITSSGDRCGLQTSDCQNTTATTPASVSWCDDAKSYNSMITTPRQYPQHSKFKRFMNFCICNYTIKTNTVSSTEQIQIHPPNDDNS